MVVGGSWGEVPHVPAKKGAQKANTLLSGALRGAAQKIPGAKPKAKKKAKPSKPSTDNLLVKTVGLLTGGYVLGTAAQGRHTGDWGGTWGG